MLYRVFGPAGSGKTQYLYSVLTEAFRAGEPCVWITPESQSFQTERQILNLLGNAGSGLVEVMTFGEMPDIFARRYGGFSETFLDRGAIIALLSVLASENRDRLEEYMSSAEDPGFLEDLLQLFKRLRSAMITPERLEDAVSKGKWENRSRLRRKLKDVSVLYRAYDGFFNEERKDARTRLTMLSERLPKCPYFSGKTVFIDGFYRFQEQELAVLKCILSQAKNVWCGFAGEAEGCGERELFSRIRMAADKLARLAPGDNFKDIRMTGYTRSADPAFAYLEKHMWSESSECFCGPADRIRLIRADNPFDESHAVASKIMELVRNGKRFRDIAVFIRNPQSYTGILDAVFRASNIPFFFSEKNDIMANPLIAFVCGALEMAATRFSTASVRRYLKTGYAGLPSDEIDLLLRYADAWSVRGSDWVSGDTWKRNPDGYRPGRMTEEQQSALDAVNEALAHFRKSVRNLMEAFEKWNAEYKVDDIILLLCTHLSLLESSKRFTDRVNTLLEAGEEEAARKESQIWESLMVIFDRLHDICGNKAMTVQKFLTLFRLTAEQYDVGTIPSGADCVTVGNPSGTRPDDAKAVFLMGCNEGVFPASAGRGGLFDEDETGFLCQADLPLSDPIEDRMIEERYDFYTAVTTPSEYLFLSYPSGAVSGESLRPSFGLNRIRTLFPNVEAEAFDAGPEKLLYSAASAASVFPLLADGEGKEEIRSILTTRKKPFRGTWPDLFDPDVRVTEDGRSVRLSPSSLDRYRGCPFSYFGRDLLKLKEKKQYAFSRQEMGTLLHSVLEAYLRRHVSNGRFVPPKDKTSMENETNELFDALLREAGATQEPGKQFLHTCENYRKTVQAAVSDLTEEFRNSSFVPIGFEVPIGRKEGGLPPLTLHTEDGRSVSLTGVIDRVDGFSDGGNEYVRVVDYKSYNKSLDLSLSDRHGLDEQMLLYLIAFCKGAEKNSSVVPAGVLYDSLQMKPVKVDGAEPEEVIRQKVEEGLRIGRDGLLLDDEKVLLAMDASGNGKFLPNVYTKKGGLNHESKNLKTKEGFQEMFSDLENKLRETGERILNGEMRISPVKHGQYDACAYCPMKNACRYKEKEG